MDNVASYSTADWSRLGTAIRKRRVARGVTQEQLADAAGCSVNTVRNLEQGKKARQLTLPRLCVALGWTEDSYAQVLDGNGPTVVEPVEETDALRVERPDGLSDEEWTEITAKMLDDLEFWLRRRG